MISKHPLETTHNHYDMMIDDWRMMSDIRQGQTCLKKRDLAKFGTYLTWLDAGNESEQNKQRNRQYIKMATFQNVTARTAQGMVGEIMRTPPSIEAPPQFDMLLNDIDGNGLALEQQVRDSVDEVLYKGGVGLLPDFPSFEGSLTVADMETIGARPVVSMYVQETILDWATSRIGAFNKLSYVLLSEGDKKRRVLRLDDTGHYTQEVWEKLEDVADWVKTEYFEPRFGDGSRLSFIPFYRCGALNNTIDIDTIPLIDIAHVNMGQYRNNADAEFNSYMSSHMQTWVSGLTETWMSDVWNGKLELGPSNPVVALPQGAAVTTTQARETSSSAKLAESKRREMVELGAKLIEPQSGNKTATQAELEASSESSILSMVAQNIMDVYQSCLEVCARFMNLNAEQITFTMSTKFSFSKMSAQDRQQLILEWQSGLISKSVARLQLRQDGIIPSDIDDEMMDEENRNTEF